MEPDRAHVDLFRRGDDGLWVLHPEGPEGTVRRQSAGQELLLSVIYEDVVFSRPVGMAVPNEPT